jgi:hypothetical protein
MLVAFGILRDNWQRKAAIAGTVSDALSGDPVYKARIIVGGKTTIRHLDKNFQMTNLKPGVHQIIVKAPGYEPLMKEFSLKRGPNFINIRLHGKEIPELDHVIVFADSVKTSGIKLEIRFVNTRGIGIKHFPSLAMTMDAELFVRIGSKEKYRRGRLIYAGPVDLFWDSRASLGKNKGIIPKSKLKVNPETDGMIGVLDLVLQLEQGDFEVTLADILLDF